MKRDIFLWCWELRKQNVDWKSLIFIRIKGVTPLRKWMQRFFKFCFSWIFYTIYFCEAKELCGLVLHLNKKKNTKKRKSLTAKFIQSCIIYLTTIGSCIKKAHRMQLTASNIKFLEFWLEEISLDWLTEFSYFINIV